MAHCAVHREAWRLLQRRRHHAPGDPLEVDAHVQQLEQLVAGYQDNRQK